MSTEMNAGRPILPLIPENLFMANLRAGIHIMPIGEITEDEIAVFCGDCENLTLENTCKVLDLNTQAVCADRKYCDLAILDSTKGTMLEDGFSPK